MKIEQATPSTIKQVWSGVDTGLSSAGSLEAAAQALTTALHEQFKESVVISRVFLTVPFSALPATNRKFVENLAGALKAADKLRPATPVLSLVGTHGAKADWCDPKKSKGHLGIPLVSSEFVGGIPMISRLLKELGVPLDWVESQDVKIIRSAVGDSSPLFFVDDASQATDQMGRKIIAAQDFVADNGVKTVFGTGRLYAGSAILVLVMFCRDAVPREAAEQFLGLVESFAGRAGDRFGTKQVFAQA